MVCRFLPKPIKHILWQIGMPIRLRLRDTAMKLMVHCASPLLFFQISLLLELCDVFNLETTRILLLLSFVRSYVVPEGFPQCCRILCTIYCMESFKGVRSEFLDWERDKFVQSFSS